MQKMFSPCGKTQRVWFRALNYHQSPAVTSALSGMGLRTKRHPWRVWRTHINSIIAIWNDIHKCITDSSAEHPGCLLFRESPVAHKPTTAVYHHREDPEVRDQCSSVPWSLTVMQKLWATIRNCWREDVSAPHSDTVGNLFPPVLTVSGLSFCPL